MTLYYSGKLRINQKIQKYIHLSKEASKPNQSKCKTILRLQLAFIIPQKHGQSKNAILDYFQMSKKEVHIS